MPSWAFQLEITGPPGRNDEELWESRKCIPVSSIEGDRMKSNGSQKRSKIPIATQEGEIHLQGPESSVEVVAEAEGS